MAESDIPEDVQVLLREAACTYEALEVIQLLQADPTCSWTAQEASAKLKFPAGPTAHALERLAIAGVLSRQGRAAEPAYAFAPKDQSTAQTLRRLAECYREQRLDIVRLLSAGALERVRSAALHRFADAFHPERRPKSRDDENE